MVEQVFVAPEECDRDTEFPCVAGAVDSTVSTLRDFDPVGLDVGQMEDLAVRFETLRRTLAAATARNRVELHRRLTPPAPSDEGTDGGSGDTRSGSPGSGADAGGRDRGPRPGDRGDKAGTDHDESRRQTKLAQVAATLPSAIEAFDAGDITEAHLRTLWMAVQKDEARARRDEDRLVGWAKVRPPWRFRKMVANWCRFGEDPADRDAEHHERRGVHVDDGHPDGMVRVNAHMPTADGKSFTACLDAMAEDIYREAHPDRPTSRDQVTSTLAQRRHDALVEMARRCATPRGSGHGPATDPCDEVQKDAGPDGAADAVHAVPDGLDAAGEKLTRGPDSRTGRPPGTRRRRPVITLIATVDQLRDHLGLVHAVDRVRERLGLETSDERAGLAETPHGDTLSPADLRRVACDAEILPMVMDGESRPLDVGRSTRTIPPQLWDALVVRDRGCRFCGAPAEWCDVHHIIHWADGGPTDLANTVLACTRDHDAIHKSRLVVTGTADDLEWHHATPSRTHAGAGGARGSPGGARDGPGGADARRTRGPAGDGGARHPRRGDDPPGPDDGPGAGGRLFAA